MSRVCESWDPIHSQTSSPVLPFSVKPTPALEENRQVVLLFWPKTHMCVAVDWCYAIWTTILVPYQGSWIIGWESQMDFYSSLIIFYQTSPHFWGKLTSFVDVLDQNSCVWDCRSVLCYSKVNLIAMLVKTSSWVRSMKLGTKLVAMFLIQSSPFPTKPGPVLEQQRWFC